ASREPGISINGHRSPNQRNAPHQEAQEQCGHDHCQALRDSKQAEHPEDIAANAVHIALSRINEVGHRNRFQNTSKRLKQHFPYLQWQPKEQVFKPLSEITQHNQASKKVLTATNAHTASMIARSGANHSAAQAHIGWNESVPNIGTVKEPNEQEPPEPNDKRPAAETIGDPSTRSMNCEVVSPKVPTSSFSGPPNSSSSPSSPSPVPEPQPTPMQSFKPSPSASPLPSTAQC